MKRKNKVIAVTGPTGTGKTALAVELAKLLDTEIISSDSRQIFKGFNIAAAKPTIEEMQGIPHHLMDIVNPNEEYTVANFKDDAESIMAGLFEKGKTPILTGGTGLYFRILLENYEMPRVAPNKALRAELHEIVEKQGVDALYKMLVELDPALALKMHPNNTVKIVRALEVCKTLGVPMSEAATTKDKEYDVTWIGLGSENRQFLYDRTDKRVDLMFEAGLENEAKELFAKWGKASSLLNTIGYQEMNEYFEGRLSFEDAVSLMKQNTRHYVKRQLTWFRRNEEINWVDIEMYSNPEKMLCFLREKQIIN